eukprot:m.856740 g.856740  ORF g.856740 m.856740 type:complete len:607 (+) comp23516_c0_seq2:212-2032(+)
MNEKNSRMYALAFFFVALHSNTLVARSDLDLCAPDVSCMSETSGQCRTYIPQSIPNGSAYCYNASCHASGSLCDPSISDGAVTQFCRDSSRPTLKCQVDDPCSRPCAINSSGPCYYYIASSPSRVCIEPTEAHCCSAPLQSCELNYPTCINAPTAARVQKIDDCGSLYPCLDGTWGPCAFFGLGTTRTTPLCMAYEDAEAGCCPPNTIRCANATINPGKQCSWGNSTTVGPPVSLHEELCSTYPEFACADDFDGPCWSPITGSTQGLCMPYSRSRCCEQGSIRCANGTVGDDSLCADPLTTVAAGTSTEEPNLSIMRHLESHPRSYSFFVELIVDAVGSIELLLAKEKVTVFAVKNSVFTALPQRVQDRLFSDAGFATNVVRRHVGLGSHELSSGGQISTLNGTISVLKSSDGFLVYCAASRSSATVDVSNIAESNGYLNVVDGLFLSSAEQDSAMLSGTSAPSPAAPDIDHASSIAPRAERTQRVTSQESTAASSIGTAATATVTATAAAHGQQTSSGHSHGPPGSLIAGVVAAVALLGTGTGMLVKWCSQRQDRSTHGTTLALHTLSTVDTEVFHEQADDVGQEGRAPGTIFSRMAESIGDTPC